MSDTDPKYLYRREDTGAVVSRPFSAVLSQDPAGYITLEDGVLARRCWHLEDAGRLRTKKAVVDDPNVTAPKAVSDSLGFTEQQLRDFEADRDAHGFRDIEFHRDPDVPQFFQVHAASRAAMMKYARHRGMRDLSNRGSVYLTQADMDRAAEIAGRASDVREAG